MDSTEYTDLRTIINKNVKLKIAIPEQTVALYIAKCLTALHTLHIKGITHQGIKPENIHIPKDDEFEVHALNIKLLQSVNEPGDDRELKEGVKYWAPEVFTSQKYLPVSDVYSIGAVFYEVLTGKPPYPQTDKPALAHFIMHEKLLPPTIVPNDTYSKKIIDFIATLLGKDPATRPTAAAAYKTLSITYPTLSLPALPPSTSTQGVLVYPDIPVSMDVLRKKLVKEAKTIPDPTKTQSTGALSSTASSSSSSSYNPFKFSASSSSSASSSYTPYTPPGAGAAGGGRFAGFKKPAGVIAPGPTPAPKKELVSGTKSSVSYLRSIFEKGVANSFSFSPSAYAQGVKRLNHYDARGNLIEQMKGGSIMDRLRKRKVRASDLTAGSAADLTDASLSLDFDAAVEEDNTNFDDFFAKQQTEVNTQTRQQNTPTQAVQAVLTNTLPASVLAADINTLANSAGTAAAQNVAALWRAEGRVRDLAERLGGQEKSGAPQQEVQRTKHDLKVAEAEVQRLRSVVAADEKAQASQSDARRRHRAELARAEALARQAREKLAALEKPGSGASQGGLDTARAALAKTEAEVQRLRAIVQADDDAQNAPHRAELARAEAVLRQAREHLVLLEKPGSGATATQTGEARTAVKTAEAEVARLRGVVAQDEAAQNARNQARTVHRADLAHAEIVAQQAHEHLTQLEEPNSGASDSDLAAARKAASEADADVERKRAIVQKDDEEYAAWTAKDGSSESTTFTALTVHQLSLMEQGVLKVSEMLEKGETDIAKVFDDGVAELVLKTLMLANNGFAAAIEKISRNKSTAGVSSLSAAELSSAEENFIANAYVINACLYIINNFSLSPDSRHRQILIEGYNAISIILTSLALSPLSSPAVVTLPDDVSTEKEADIITASFALSDLFNISVGSLNEDEEENARREEEGEDVDTTKRENRMKKFFVKEEDENIRKLFGFILNYKTGAPVVSTTASASAGEGVEAAQEAENKLLALRILFTIYKSSPLPSVVTNPQSPAYSGPYATIVRGLLRFMNTHIAGTWNPRKGSDVVEKRKEVITSVVQFLLAILYVVDVNHNLHLFVEEGFGKTLATISGSSPAQSLLPDSDEEERKTYALLISTSVTVLDKLFVVPFKSPDAATSSDLTFLRSAETAAFIVASIVPVLTRTISECLPVPAAVASATDATTLPFGALYSLEDQNSLRDEAIACIAAFLKNNILTATSLPSTNVVAAFAAWIRAAGEVLAQWIVEGSGDEEDTKSYSLHIHIIATLLNNLLIPPFKIGTHVAENNAFDAFFSLINNKYVNLSKNNALLLPSTYPKIAAILNTFVVNFAIIGANSSPPGKENIFLPYYLKNDQPQYLARVIESAAFATAFTPAQQFGFVRATFFFFRDFVVDPAVIQPSLRFLHTFLSNPAAPLEDVKVALKCLVVLASKKENHPTLKSANLTKPLENFVSSANADVSKTATQLRTILK